MSQGSSFNLWSANREDDEDPEVGIKFMGDFNANAYDKIRNFFSKFGEIDEINFKDSKVEEMGSGYLYFKNSENVNKVFEQYGYRVKVDKETILTLEKTHKNRSLAMTCIDSSVSSEFLFDKLKSYGTIKNIEYPEDGDKETVFVEYANRKDAESAKDKLEELSKHYLQPWRVMWADDSLLNCSVFISFDKHQANQERINRTFNENKIAEEFNLRFRKVRKIELKIDNQGRYIDNGIVYFENNYSGELAVIHCCGRQQPNEILVGKVKVKIERRKDELNEKSDKSKERANKFRGTNHLDLLEYNSPSFSKHQ
ncbi:MAG: hypothetical protein EZS28_032279 [Streblomastix strix]|uniref:RRM domain-containing protein n=1 Tax=Streblomastix strix TaxID=222440 RepID=A0A5J4UPT6_9EUKA|nr:MAG: hypothetical protein EZS28_032279 [Streblomastix strix]